jgi:hypothetical protein
MRPIGLGHHRRSIARCYIHGQQDATVTFGEPFEISIPDEVLWPLKHGKSVAIQPVSTSVCIQGTHDANVKLLQVL